MVIIKLNNCLEPITVPSLAVQDTSSSTSEAVSEVPSELSHQESVQSPLRRCTMTGRYPAYKSWSRGGHSNNSLGSRRASNAAQPLPAPPFRANHEPGGRTGWGPILQTPL